MNDEPSVKIPLTCPAVNNWFHAGVEMSVSVHEGSAGVLEMQQTSTSAPGSPGHSASFEIVSS